MPKLNWRSVINTIKGTLTRLNPLKYFRRAERLQAYILDTSGSMHGSIDLVTMLCFAVSQNAKRKLDKFAILAFSNTDRPELLLKPGRDYNRIPYVLGKLESGGLTHLAPALRWMNEYCTKKHLKPAAIIFTDTHISDTNEALLELQATRTQLHGTSLLVNTTEYTPNWVQAAKQRDLLEVFSANRDLLEDNRQILQHIA